MSNVFAALKFLSCRIRADADFAELPGIAQSIRISTSSFGFTKLTTSSEPLRDAETETSSAPVPVFSTRTAVFDRCGLNSSKA